MLCPNCHKEVKQNTNFCEYCGFKFRKLEENFKKDKEKSIKKIVLISLIFISLIFIIIINLTNNSKQKLNATQEKQIQQLEQNKSVASPQVTTNKPSLDKIVLISKGFGYTQYGEAGVVGKIKNNNDKALYIRADIDLVYSYGNKIGDTYTYQEVQPYSIWNFEAPTFGVLASDMKIYLSIDTE